MGQLIDETGKRYGSWTILSFIPVNERDNRNKAWIAQCDCGTVRPVRIGDLRNGKSASCGRCKCKDYHITIGKKYGMLTVLEQVTNE